MTSEQIKSLSTPDEFASEARLFIRLVEMVQEAAYQLAVMNERNNGYDGGDLPIKSGNKQPHISLHPRHGE